MLEIKELVLLSLKIPWIMHGYATRFSSFFFVIYLAQENFHHYIVTVPSSGWPHWMIVVQVVLNLIILRINYACFIE